MAAENSRCRDLKRQGEQELSDWSNLPEDLKVCILCRLPEKSLIASKRVSKDWYFLISYVCIPKLSPSAPISGFFGPCFISDPSKSSTVAFSPLGDFPPSFLMRCKEKILDILATYLDSLSFTCTANNLLDCCNGLLLLCYCTDSDTEPTRYLVGNPATRETIHIPVNAKHQNSILVDSSLVFDPTESLEFKIIRFVHSVGKAAITLLDVFYSETEEWIEYRLPPEPMIAGLGPHKSSVYLDGVLYKITGTRCLICIAVESNTDLGNLNAWTTIELPNQLSKEYPGSIGTSRGHLYYFSRNASDILLWSLNNGAQWVLDYRICICDLLHHYLGKYCYKKLGDKMCSALQPCVLLSISDGILLETPWFLVIYKLNEQEFSFYDIQGRGCETRRLGQSFPYSRSLVILKSTIHRHYGSSASFRSVQVKIHSPSHNAVTKVQT